MLARNTQFSEWSVAALLAVASLLTALIAVNIQDPRFSSVLAIGFNVLLVLGLLFSILIHIPAAMLRRKGFQEFARRQGFESTDLTKEQAQQGLDKLAEDFEAVGGQSRVERDHSRVRRALTQHSKLGQLWLIDADRITLEGVSNTKRFGEFVMLVAHKPNLSLPHFEMDFKREPQPESLNAQVQVISREPGPLELFLDARLLQELQELNPGPVVLGHAQTVVLLAKRESHLDREDYDAWLGELHELLDRLEAAGQRFQQRQHDQQKHRQWQQVDPSTSPRDHRAYAPTRVDEGSARSHRDLYGSTDQPWERWPEPPSGLVKVCAEDHGTLRWAWYYGLAPIFIAGLIHCFLTIVFSALLHFKLRWPTQSAVALGSVPMALMMLRLIFWPIRPEIRFDAEGMRLSYFSALSLFTGRAARVSIPWSEFAGAAVEIVGHAGGKGVTAPLYNIRFRVRGGSVFMKHGIDNGDSTESGLGLSEQELHWVVERIQDVWGTFVELEHLE